MEAVVCGHCGAPLQVESRQRVATCPYCQKSTRLFDRIAESDDDDDDDDGDDNDLDDEQIQALVAQVRKKYPPGTVVKGNVSDILELGVFVQIEEGIEGLVHVSDMSTTEPVKPPSEMFHEGDEVEAVVLDIDGNDGVRISLGIKQLADRPA